MISLKECRKILGKKGKHLSDEQLEAVREALYKVAQINVHIINEKKNRKDEESSNNV